MRRLQGPEQGDRQEPLSAPTDRRPARPVTGGDPLHKPRPTQWVSSSTTQARGNAEDGLQDTQGAVRIQSHAVRLG